MVRKKIKKNKEKYELVSFSKMIMSDANPPNDVLHMNDLCPNQDLVIKKKRKKNTKKI